LNLIYTRILRTLQRHSLATFSNTTPVSPISALSSVVVDVDDDVDFVNDDVEYLLLLLLLLLFGANPSVANNKQLNNAKIIKDDIDIDIDIDIDDDLLFILIFIVMIAL
jgi:hypothetical protein